jgi:hypothetical protein
MLPLTMSNWPWIVLDDIEGSKTRTREPKSGAGPGGLEPPPHSGVVVQLGGQSVPVLVGGASGGIPASGVLGLGASEPASGLPLDIGRPASACAPASCDCDCDGAASLGPPAEGHSSGVDAESEQPRVNTSIADVVVRKTVVECMRIQE